METSEGYGRAARELLRMMEKERAEVEALRRRLPEDAPPWARRMADSAVELLGLHERALKRAMRDGPEALWLRLKRRSLRLARAAHKAEARLAKARGDAQEKKRYDRLAYALDQYIATLNANLRYLRSALRLHTNAAGPRDTDAV